MIPPILRRVEALGFVVFDGLKSGVGDPNLIVERAPALRAGSLDDLAHLVQRTPTGWRDLAWPCSVDPGRRALASPSRHPGGVLVLATAQNLASHQRGLHRGRPALVQVGSVAFRRDDDGDDLVDPGGPVFVEVGRGANVHDDAGVGAEASEGCVVAAKAAISELLAELARAEPWWGLRVSLTVVPA